MEVPVDESGSGRRGPRQGATDLVAKDGCRAKVQKGTREAGGDEHDKSGQDAVDHWFHRLPAGHLWAGMEGEVISPEYRHGKGKVKGTLGFAPKMGSPATGESGVTAEGFQIVVWSARRECVRSLAEEADVWSGSA